MASPQHCGAQCEDHAIVDLVTAMRTTLDKLGHEFKVLHKQSQQVTDLRPTMEDSTRQIEALRLQIPSEGRKQEASVKELKRKVREALKQRVVPQMKKPIADQVREHIIMQVKTQVDLQMNEHLAVPLKQQAVDITKQLAAAQISLENSDARRANAKIGMDDMDEPITVVVKANGEKSDIFPADLRSLLFYDSATSKALVKEYGLDEDEVREVNLNRFMAHIGTRAKMQVPPSVRVVAQD